jgi:hypothetical protein
MNLTSYLEWISLILYRKQDFYYTNIMSGIKMNRANVYLIFIL